ncbi:MULTISPECIES: ABC transporter permease [unclassified Rhizobium]|jgi:peptide/nickel transport system permease protein|uniref:ABC transporter permease n=1 Tax=unclassified Rhizobium TaxID=2613769 RepID=UPI000647DE23|nr:MULTISPECIES: ABC transporter permease [unclassified Rhizobium]MBN8953601.1 ABC transporter permease [Rhizobium tropici]OJY79049.1 MAG: ABC transporter permease [Rhizobium sp. 60-20]RKD67781.1 peptide/nickel transport system permease protein [Rhizobium sp. WW_1]
MASFILRRSGQALIVLIVMSILVFIGVYVIGNPIDVLISPDVTQEIRQRVIEEYGLNQPLWKQYIDFVLKTVSGDFGRSFVFNMPVVELIAQRLPATLELAVIAVLLASVIGVPLGVYAGYRPDGFLPKLILAGSILGFSVPTFWIGLMLIMIFAVQLGILPAGGRGATIDLFGVPFSFLTGDGWMHLALPVLNLALFKMAMMCRLAAAGTREIMTTDTIKFARAAGIPEGTILRKHVLKLISIPLVTVFGLELGSTVAFALVTETIFNWPGLGKLIVDSIASLDRPVMVAYLMMVAVLFVVINLCVDLAYAFLDPRLRQKGR